MTTCIPRVDGLSTDPLVWGVTMHLHDNKKYIITLIMHTLYLNEKHDILRVYLPFVSSW